MKGDNQLRFENKTLLEMQDIKGVNLQIYLKTPLYIVLYIVCILSIAARLVDYFVSHIINLSAVVPFILALLAMVFVYFANNRTLYRQSTKENGEPIKFTYILEDNILKITTDEGKSHQLDIRLIYKSFESKNCFALRGRDNSFFIIKKSGFILGTAEEFSKLLKENKN